MSGSPGRRLLPVVLFSLLVFEPRAAFAQQASPPQSPGLGALSLEDLMKVRIEPVFGASKRIQPVTDAPALVTIITAEDIARHGYRTLADILAGVRGFTTTNDRNYSYLGVSGLAIPGDYNTRILLLIDGHRMNDNIYDQAQVGAELGIDPLSFERVEIIRGPASSLYGTSAFFAVINIVTKSGATANGIQVSAEGGSFGSGAFRLAAGHQFTKDIDGAVFVHVRRTDGLRRIYFPEFDSQETNGGVADGLDDEQTRQVNGHLRIGRLRLAGAFGYRDKAVPTAAFETVFGDPRFRTSDLRFFVDGAYDATIGNTRFNVHAFADKYRYDGAYPGHGYLFVDYADGIWTGVEGRMTRPISKRHTLTAGTEWRQNVRQRQGGRSDEDPESSFTLDATSNVTAAYLQDEFAVGRHVVINSGVRLDRYRNFTRLAPRIGVIVKPSENEAIKYLFGNAFRAPNAYEEYYYGRAPIGLAPETISAHEIAWERYFGDWLRTSVSAYFNHINGLIALTRSTEGALTFANSDKVDGVGAALEAEVRLGARMKLLTHYSRQRTVESTTRTQLINSPAHVGAVRLSVIGPRGLDGALDLRATGDRRLRDGFRMPTVAVLDAGVRVPFRQGWALAASVRNLLDKTYGDPGSEEHLQLVIPQNGRAWRVELSWSWLAK